jgi:HK97 family phage prohead protease
MINRADLLDIPERRSVPVAEFDVSEKNGVARVEGYASIFDKGYDIAGGPDVGGWTEFVNRAAFKTTLAAKPDVVLLENHTGGPLARTKSGTLTLGTDSTGLLSSSELDLRDPQAKSVFIKLERGDYDEMSFAFRVKANTWSEDDTQRSLDEVSLHKGDVSIVNFGANPYTSVGLRSAVKLLAREDWSDEEMAELRAMSNQVNLAMQRLETARTDAPLTPGAHHADPGYLDADGHPARDGNGVPRYQIDDKVHAVAAASLFAQFKNKYTAAQQEEILGKIHAAEKKFGVGDEQNSISITDTTAVNNAVEYVRASSVENLDIDKVAQEAWTMLSRAMGLDSEGIQGPDNDAGGGGDSLARAVHDLIADAAGCTVPAGPTDIPSDLPQGRNLTVVAAHRASASEGNLSLDAAYRMCRPEDSPEPLSLADAEQLAS